MHLTESVLARRKESMGVVEGTESVHINGACNCYDADSSAVLLCRPDQSDTQNSVHVRTWRSMLPTRGRIPEFEVGILAERECRSVARVDHCTFDVLLCAEKITANLMCFLCRS